MNEPNEPKDVESELIAWIEEERRFLHDISTPITVAIGMSDSALDHLQKDVAVTAVKLGKAKNALDRLGKLLSERRERLHSLSANLSR